MIVEVVDIDIVPGSEGAFEAAYAEGARLVLAAKGCRSVRLLRDLERPSHYRVFAEWDTVANHADDFVGTPGHTRLRELIRPHFERPAQTEHHSIIVDI